MSQGNRSSSEERHLLKPGKHSGMGFYSTCYLSKILTLKDPKAGLRCKILTWIRWYQGLTPMTCRLSAWYQESFLLKLWSQPLYLFEFISEIVSTNLVRIYQRDSFHNLPSGRQWNWVTLLMKGGRLYCTLYPILYIWGNVVQFYLPSSTPTSSLSCLLSIPAEILFHL